jgi:TfoX/Sxy family transcriptional regulator of competence genes
MAYDEELAVRVRGLLAGEAGLTEKKMFGGLAFLIGGNMAVAASGQGGLLLRCDPEETDELTAGGEATVAVMRGRAMPGWLRIESAAVADDASLRRWVDVGVAYAGTLQPK